MFLSSWSDHSEAGGMTVRRTLQGSRRWQLTVTGNFSDFQNWIWWELSDPFPSVVAIERGAKERDLRSPGSACSYARETNRTKLVEWEGDGRDSDDRRAFARIAVLCGLYGSDICCFFLLYRQDSCASLSPSIEIRIACMSWGRWSQQVADSAVGHGLRCCVGVEGKAPRLYPATCAHLMPKPCKPVFSMDEENRTTLESYSVRNFHSPDDFRSLDGVLGAFVPGHVLHSLRDLNQSSRKFTCFELAASLWSSRERSSRLSQHLWIASAGTLLASRMYHNTCQCSSCKSKAFILLHELSTSFRRSSQ